jgi:hypothetical protein
MSESVDLAAPRASLTFDSKVLAIQVALAVVVAMTIDLQVLKSGVFFDFSAFWAAHHVAVPYDSATLSRAAGGKTMFPYPPTFLLLTEPFAWLPKSAAYLGWTALCAAAAVASLRRLSAPLVLATPAMFMAIVGGQTSLVMAALLFTGATLRHRPLLAGALLGVAACIKPQVVVLVPLVLLAAGQWRSLAGAAAAGLSLCLAATLCYGVGVWSDWLGFLPTFLAANDHAFAARYLALPGLWKAAALGAGVLASAYAGRRGRIELGVFVAVAAALLGSLHAMDYDAAILAPFAMSAAVSNRWFGLPFAAALAFPPSAMSVLALMVLAGCSLLQAWPIQGLQSISKQNGNML